jgi:hypothetical protein
MKRGFYYIVGGSTVQLLDSYRDDAAQRSTLFNLFKECLN